MSEASPTAGHTTSDNQDNNSVVNSNKSNACNCSAADDSITATSSTGSVEPSSKSALLLYPSPRALTTAASAMSGEVKGKNFGVEDSLNKGMVAAVNVLEKAAATRLEQEAGIEQHEQFHKDNPGSSHHNKINENKEDNENNMNDNKVKQEDEDTEEEEMENTRKQTKSKKRKNTDAATVGRRGDPRMHRAVACRLENPGLKLVDALRLGGFDVDGSSGEPDALAKLGQRKNQLSRRLRLAKNRFNKGDTTCGNLRLTSEDNNYSSSNVSVIGKHNMHANNGYAVAPTSKDGSSAVSVAARVNNLSSSFGAYGKRGFLS